LLITPTPNDILQRITSCVIFLTNQSLTNLPNLEVLKSNKRFKKREQLIQNGKCRDAGNIEQNAPNKGKQITQ